MPAEQGPEGRGSLLGDQRGPIPALPESVPSREWAEERRRAEEEKQKVEKLMRAVEEWQKSKRIREYIATIAEMAATGKYTFNFEGGLDNWLKWARTAADRIDPLFPAPKSPKEPQEKPDGGGDPPKRDF
jgi:hypothetical protein